MNIIKHTNLTERVKKAISKCLTKHTVEEIKTGISNYNTMLKDESCWFSYKWTLFDFLSRQNGLELFLEDGERWVQYQQSKHKPFKATPKRYSDNISVSETDEARLREEYRGDMESLLPDERVSFEEWRQNK